MQNLVLFVVILIANCNAEFQFKCWVASCSKWHNIILSLVTNCLHNCDWIWQNPASTHRAMLGDMKIQLIALAVTSWWINYAEKLKITASTCLIIIRRQLKARGPVWGPTGPSLYSQHSKLKITDINWPCSPSWLVKPSKHQYKKAMTI